MLLVAQERGTEQRHDYAVEESERPAAVGVGDQREHAAGFEDSPNLSHVGGQVAPVIVRLHRRDNVESAIGEWQRGNRTLLDVDSPAAISSALVSRETATLAAE